MKQKDDLALDSALIEGRSLWQDTWRAFYRNKAAVASIFVLVFFAVISVAAPVTTPYDPNTFQRGYKIVKPFTTRSPEDGIGLHCHWEGTFLEEAGCRLYIFGTDSFSRDLFSRVVYAVRVSLAVALVASTVSIVIGVLYGTLAGYLGGQIDELMMRFVDFLYSIPVFLVVLGIQSYVSWLWFAEDEGFIGFLKWLRGANDAMGGLLFIFIAIGAVNWVGMARLARAMVHSAKQNEYITAARAVGAGDGQVIFRHLIPNIIGPLVVMETLNIPTYIFLEATLSFLGLGVNADTPSLGAMIRSGYPGLHHNPQLVLIPSIVLALITLAFNFMGDGLRDAIDPQIRNSR
ncbi:MAG: ABC transporter permease [Anaerolineales bacterium]|jgi:oligopeptide transport system permease protein